MKTHLIAARLWEIVYVGVMIPTDEDRDNSRRSAQSPSKCTSRSITSVKPKSG